ncbi:hypothetical protein C8J57DRAFT_1233241 [Mycena rebaudengoi]|nr:hypothetical protein C8J57DRAFT_1233241 [Mycena rebaudengoi]
MSLASETSPTPSPGTAGWSDASPVPRHAIPGGAIAGATIGIVILLFSIALIFAVRTRRIRTIQRAASINSNLFKTESAVSSQNTKWRRQELEGEIRATRKKLVVPAVPPETSQQDALNALDKSRRWNEMLLGRIRELEAQVEVSLAQEQAEESPPAYMV